MEHLKLMGRLFGRKQNTDYDSYNNPSKKLTEDRNNTDRSDWQKHELYKKGIEQMSNEKLEDAIRSFDLSLRIDPTYVDAWIKKGYAHFHLGEYSVAITCYDKALDIDLNNAEAWNLKGLAYYKMRNYADAIIACDKAVDINPNDAMSWYNKACYLALIGKVDDGMEALKRSIEIDISNAKRAVRDRDFDNARAEEGFQRIIEVVVLESIRQGYDYVGKIVWITGMGRQEVEDAMERLSMKGLTLKREKKSFVSKEEYYELTKDIAEKVGSARRSGFLGKTKEVYAPLQQLRDISQIVNRAKDSVEKGEVDATLDSFDQLISPAKHGSAMI